MLGIVNTLALAVLERTRELGLLRAVGLGRRQTRRMVTVEAVIVAVLGALLGIAVGSVFAVARAGDRAHVPVHTGREHAPPTSRRPSQEAP